MKVCMTKRPFRSTRKAFVRQEEARALTAQGDPYQNRVCLLQRPQKTEINRCYRYLGFGHMAANCRGPDRSRCSWWCGEEGHAAGSCSRKPRCYLCSTREKKPRDDHIPGTMHCVAFRKAAPNRKPLRSRE